MEKQMIKEGTKERSSNLELLRIVSMLLIVAHHFVVNSGVTALYDFHDVSPNMLFLQLWGMWGKTAINVFILISGYFMCQSRLTLRRFGKVYLEAKFYVVLIYFILLIVGYETKTVDRLLNVLFGFIRNPGNGFTSSFLMFYLFVPFYNMLINGMDKRQHRWLIALLLTYFTIAPMLLRSNHVFFEPLWYAVLYFVAAYIRLYPAKWTENNTVCGISLIATVLLSFLSVITVDFVGVRFGFFDAYYMVSDSNHLFAFLVGLFAFLFFRNLKMRNSRFVNRVAATTFGVLCIHASSDAMRTLLWKDVLDVAGHFSLPMPKLILFSAASAVTVFAVCSLIDMLRIRFVEKPVFRWLTKFDWFNKELY